MSGSNTWGAIAEPQCQENCPVNGNCNCQEDHSECTAKRAIGASDDKEDPPQCATGQPYWGCCRTTETKAPTMAPTKVPFCSAEAQRQVPTLPAEGRWCCGRCAPGPMVPMSDVASGFDWEGLANTDDCQSNCPVNGNCKCAHHQAVCEAERAVGAGNNPLDPPTCAQGTAYWGCCAGEAPVPPPVTRDFCSAEARAQSPDLPAEGWWCCGACAPEEWAPQSLSNNNAIPWELLREPVCKGPGGGEGPFTPQGGGVNECACTSNCPTNGNCVCEQSQARCRAEPTGQTDPGNEPVCSTGVAYWGCCALQGTPTHAPMPEVVPPPTPPPTDVPPLCSVHAQLVVRERTGATLPPDGWWCCGSCGMGGNFIVLNPPEACTENCDLEDHCTCAHPDQDCVSHRATKIDEDPKDIQFVQCASDQCGKTAFWGCCDVPWSNPTEAPTAFPSIPPTGFPSHYPSQTPTSFPTQYPTAYPTGYPTKFPTQFPTQFPTAFPTVFPTRFPSTLPTKYPTYYPTQFPTRFPSAAPTKYPTHRPTEFPTTFPTQFPTGFPSQFPTAYPSRFPTRAPTLFPTAYPTQFPTTFPSKYPTGYPSQFPSHTPTQFPTNWPTKFPTRAPTQSPEVPPCDENVEILFVLDGSGSINDESWECMIKMTGKISDEFTFGCDKGAASMGFLQFPNCTGDSDAMKQELTCDKDSFTERLNNGWDRNMGWTHTGDALEQARIEFERRGNKEKHRFVVVLTDGLPCMPPPGTVVVGTEDEWNPSSCTQHRPDMEEYPKCGTYGTFNDKPVPDARQANKAREQAHMLNLEGIHVVTLAVGPSDLGQLGRNFMLDISDAGVHWEATWEGSEGSLQAIVGAINGCPEKVCSDQLVNEVDGLTDKGWWCCGSCAPWHPAHGTSTTWGREHEKSPWDTANGCGCDDSKDCKAVKLDASRDECDFDQVKYWGCCEPASAPAPTATPGPSFCSAEAQEDVEGLPADGWLCCYKCTVPILGRRANGLEDAGGDLSSPTCETGCSASDNCVCEDEAAQCSQVHYPWISPQHGSHSPDMDQCPDGYIGRPGCCPRSIVPTAAPSVVCGIDMLFAIDGTGSIPAEDWGTMIDKTKDFADDFDFSCNYKRTRMGLLQFPNCTQDPEEPRQGFTCSKSEFQGAVEGLRHDRKAGWTHTGDALEKAYHMFRETSVQNNLQVLVLLSDGVPCIPPIESGWDRTSCAPQELARGGAQPSCSTYYADPEPEHAQSIKAKVYARRLQYKGVYVVTLPIGTFGNKGLEFMRNITSPGHGDHLMLPADDWGQVSDALSEMKPFFEQLGCEEPPRPDLCSASAQDDGVPAEGHWCCASCSRDEVLPQGAATPSAYTTPIPGCATNCPVDTSCECEIPRDKCSIDGKATGEQDNVCPLGSARYWGCCSAQKLAPEPTGFPSVPTLPSDSPSTDEDRVYEEGYD